jgi:hypothetical protein
VQQSLGRVWLGTALAAFISAQHRNGRVRQYPASVWHSFVKAKPRQATVEQSVVKLGSGIVSLSHGEVECRAALALHGEAKALHSRGVAK